MDLRWAIGILMGRAHTNVMKSANGLRQVPRFCGPFFYF